MAGPAGALAALAPDTVVDEVVDVGELCGLSELALGVLPTRAALVVAVFGGFEVGAVTVALGAVAEAVGVAGTVVPDVTPLGVAPCCVIPGCVIPGCVIPGCVIPGCVTVAPGKPLVGVVPGDDGEIPDCGCVCATASPRAARLSPKLHNTRVIGFMLL